MPNSSCTSRSSRTQTGLSVHSRTPAVMAHLAHGQLRRRHRHLLVGLRRAVVQPERPVDQQHVEPEEAEHRPGARQQEHHAGDEADAAEHHHEDQEAGRAQRAVRREHRRKDRGFGECRASLSGVMALNIGKAWRGKHLGKTPGKGRASARKSVRTSLARRARARPRRSRRRTSAWRPTARPPPA